MLFQLTWQGRQKFDYFILASTLALFAYEGKTLRPDKVGFNGYTIEALGLLFLICSIIASFKLTETEIVIIGSNHAVLEKEDKRTRFMKGKRMYGENTGAVMTEFQSEQAIAQLGPEIETMKAQLAKVINKNLGWYRVRNWLLLTGIVTLILARMLSPYLG